MKVRLVALGAIAVSLAAGTAMAQTISPADKDFAMKAAAGGMAEVEMGRLATENGGSPQVRAFGQRMVTDHSEANKELEAIAHRQDLAIPSAPDSQDRATAERLQTMRGNAFDTAYMHDMVQDHQKDIADFRKEAADGKDPALRTFAQKHLPVLEQHLQMAENAAPK
ncbi:MAG TPA: DUF4142 domain-containing protein [Rhodopila sp.]|jgi:putative membrane protein